MQEPDEILEKRWIAVKWILITISLVIPTILYIIDELTRTKP